MCSVRISNNNLMRNQQIFLNTCDNIFFPMFYFHFITSMFSQHLTPFPFPLIFRFLIHVHAYLNYIAVKSINIIKKSKKSLILLSTVIHKTHNAKI